MLRRGTRDVRTAVARLEHTLADIEAKIKATRIRAQAMILVGRVLDCHDFADSHRCLLEGDVATSRARSSPGTKRWR